MSVIALYTTVTAKHLTFYYRHNQHYHAATRLRTGLMTLHREYIFRDTISRTLHREHLRYHRKEEYNIF